VVHRAVGLVFLGAGVLTACDDEGSISSAASGDDVQHYEASLTVLESRDHGPELCFTVETSYPPQCGRPPVSGWDWTQVDGEETANGTTWGEFHVVGTYDGTGFTLTEAPGAPTTPPDLGRSRDFDPACDDPDVANPAHGGAEWEAMTQDPDGFVIPDLISAWVSDPEGDWDGAFTGNVVVKPGSGEAALAVVRSHYEGPVCVVERDGPSATELDRVQDELFDADSKASLGVQGAYANSRQGAVVAEVWVADDAALGYAQERWGDLVALQGILQPVT
jgi:hypothetical protein